jgi:spore maturation protein CgeB
MNQFLGILPISIAGRLIISGLFEGFRSCGINVIEFDMLKQQYSELTPLLQNASFDYLVSYDYIALKVKSELNLNLPTINYFADDPKSKLAGEGYERFYDTLSDPQHYSFCWDQSITEHINIPQLSYLPLFVNTEIYRKLHSNPSYDLMFAGRLTFEGRLEAVLSIIKAFPELNMALYSFPAHFEQTCQLLNTADRELLINRYKGFIANDIEMVAALNDTKTVINFTSQGTGNLNFRVFEALACEKFIFTDYRDEIHKLFSPGQDITYYKDKDELILQIKEYFSGPEKYESIIINGRNTVVENYSHVHSAQKILNIIRG